MDERQHDERHYSDERRDSNSRDLGAVVGSGASAVSWAAVLAGAVAAAAISSLLFTLASGLDLAALSPNHGVPLASLAVSTVIALIVTQWISAGLGGYITGRLRTRWVGTHTHEVFFRDTAHGFLTWSVATLFMASGLVAGGGPFHASRTGFVSGAPAAVAGSIGAADGAASDPGQAQGASASGRELLLRLTPAGSPGGGMEADSTTASERAAHGAGRLLLPEEPIKAPDSDLTFLARLVPAPGAREARGVGEARSRVAWQASDAERQDAATVSIFTALAMLVGAFIACVAAALGGRLRDRHP